MQPVLEDNIAWHRESYTRNTNDSQHSNGGTGGGATGTCYTWKDYSKNYQKFVNWESYDYGSSAYKPSNLPLTMR